MMRFDKRITSFYTSGLLHAHRAGEEAGERISKANGGGAILLIPGAAARFIPPGGSILPGKFGVNLPGWF
jgi:hypothetical protein